MEDNSISICIRRNIFIGNIAVEGGAIQWFYNLPNIEENNLYYSNDAVYGANIAAFPLKMLVEIVSLSDKNRTNVVRLENVQSGASLNYQINVLIIDFYNNTVSSLNSE